jgi:phosphoglucan, water dikinase
MLCQDLPHLSHLGVRARQERIPLATCTSPEVIQGRLQGLVGSSVVLDVTAEDVSLEAGEPAAPATPASSNGAGADSPRSAIGGGAAVTASADEPDVRTYTFTKSSDISKAKKLAVLPVSSATAANAGAKAAVCGRLAVLSESRFSTPRGAVLPFGSMELVLAQAGVQVCVVRILVSYTACRGECCLSLHSRRAGFVGSIHVSHTASETCCNHMQEDFSSCLKTLEGAAVGAELDEAVAAMQSLMEASCLPPQEVLEALQGELAGVSIVIARSSANVEDLAGLSGAGLYESVPNLKLADDAALARGIAHVWASLYSRRAVLSRRAAGVAQADACMAVLVQVRTHCCPSCRVCHGALGSLRVCHVTLGSLQHPADSCAAAVSRCNQRCGCGVSAGFRSIWARCRASDEERVARLWARTASDA